MSRFTQPLFTVIILFRGTLWRKFFSLGFLFQNGSVLSSLSDILQGLNGILADEMGLGKTIQAMAFLAHLAEVNRIVGPFYMLWFDNLETHRFTRTGKEHLGSISGGCPCFCS